MWDLPRPVMKPVSPTLTPRESPLLVFQAPDTASPDAQTHEGWDDTRGLPCSDTESELGPASKAAALKWGQCLETSVVLTLGVGRVKSAPGKKWGRARGAANHPPRGVT